MVSHAPLRNDSFDSQESVLPTIILHKRIIRHILHHKHLLDGFDEMQIRLPPLHAAEITDRILPYQILQRLLQQRKRRLIVAAIRRQNDLRVLRQTRRRGFTPVVDGGFDDTLQVVEGGIPLHQGEHGHLVGDVQGALGVAAFGYGEAVRTQGHMVSWLSCGFFTSTGAFGWEVSHDHTQLLLGCARVRSILHVVAGGMDESVLLTYPTNPPPAPSSTLDRKCNVNNTWPSFHEGSGCMIMQLYTHRPGIPHLLALDLE